MKCKARDCPLPGEFITDWQEKQKGERSPRPKWGVCRYHRQAVGADWMRTTDRILANLTAIRVVLNYSKLTDLIFRAHKGETVEDYFARAESNLDRVILAPPDPLPAEPLDFGEIWKILRGSGNGT